ncbi:MAG: ATP-binding protein [Coriobacteriaceae bacterium]|nr:ATP-binding protein [Coriobacteriaceae bacterium]
MSYIKRHIEDVIKDALSEKGAVCVTGARQVGKSTTLKENFPAFKEASLDDSRLLRLALEYPEEFFVQFSPPVFVDEIQYAPSLFSSIKLYLDKIGTKSTEGNSGTISGEGTKPNKDNKGMFLLSGSQRYEMMSGITESLAGRVNLIDLYGLSTREIRAENFREPFLPTRDYCVRRNPEPLEYHEIWGNIWRGFFPELVRDSMSLPDKLPNGFAWQRFYSSYMRTYLDRDVSKLANVGDLLQFERFMTAMAARTGQLLNLAEVAKDVRINHATAQRWLSVLVASGIVFLLQPYHNNHLKRIIKTPKVYFLDTGLACYLLGWENPEVLQNGAMSGALFETFVFAEILKSWVNSSGVTPIANVFFYRDKDGNEIDLLIKHNGTLYPIEIKKHVGCRKQDISAFAQIDRIPDMQRGEGCVICMASDALPITDKDRAIGVSYL